MNHHTRDNWQTPQWLFDKLDEQYHFQFDCCASGENTKTSYFSRDFLSMSMMPTPAWMNPPFSKAHAMFRHLFEKCTAGVAIYRSDNFETSIWQDIIFPRADWVFQLRGRLNYEGQYGNGARFPSALVGIGVSVPTGLDGICLKTVSIEKSRGSALRT